MFFIHKIIFLIFSDQNEKKKICLENVKRKSGKCVFVFELFGVPDLLSAENFWATFIIQKGTLVIKEKNYSDWWDQDNPKSDIPKNDQQSVFSQKILHTEIHYSERKRSPESPATAQNAPKESKKCLSFHILYAFMFCLFSLWNKKAQA
jgi:hypothetical protein